MPEHAVRPLRITPLSLHDLSAAITAGWSDGDLLRAMLHDLPRRFHGLAPEGQRKVLRQRPALTRTRWDALLAATVEHIADLHGHTAPDWVDEPERFLNITWITSDVPWIRDNAIAYSPAAFIRHGALPDPRDLDHRGGEQHEWCPEPR
jgi:hypothetical protein